MSTETTPIPEQITTEKKLLNYLFEILDEVYAPISNEINIKLKLTAIKQFNKDLVVFVLNQLISFIKDPSQEFNIFSIDNKISIIRNGRKLFVLAHTLLYFLDNHNNQFKPYLPTTSPLVLKHQIIGPYSPSFNLSEAQAYFDVDRVLTEFLVVSKLLNPIIDLSQTPVEMRNIDELRMIIRQSLNENHSLNDGLNYDPETTDDPTEEKANSLRNTIFEGLRNQFLINPELFLNTLRGRIFREQFYLKILEDRTNRKILPEYFSQINFDNLTDLSKKLCAFSQKIQEIKMPYRNKETDLLFIRKLAIILYKTLRQMETNKLSEENKTERSQVIRQLFSIKSNMTIRRTSHQKQ